jgi:predicted CXXCH cytochrome family protein
LTIQRRRLLRTKPTSIAIIMKLSLRWTKNTLIFGGTATWGVLLVGCVVVNRTTLAPPFIAGATFVGNKECAECHDQQATHFGSATHAKVMLADSKLGSTGCESCHGAGSFHVKSGGSKGTIVNPGKSPEACFQCHLEKRGEFSLPNAHGVLNGSMSCGDCHDPHVGSAVKGGVASLHSQTATCTECHSAQKGPFVFKHQAMDEGCTACHNPHGSVNNKMLVSADSNLCLRCHLETASTPGIIVAGGADHRTRMQSGTCWATGCHEAVHGSHGSKALRY